MQSLLAILKRIFAVKQITTFVMVTTRTFPVGENMVQQKCYTKTRVGKVTMSTLFKKWAVVTNHGYPLIASTDLLGGRFHYSASNETQVTLPGWTLDYTWQSAIHHSFSAWVKAWHDDTVQSSKRTFQRQRHRKYMTGGYITILRSTTGINTRDGK